MCVLSRISTSRLAGRISNSTSLNTKTTHVTVFYLLRKVLTTCVENVPPAYEYHRFVENRTLGLSHAFVTRYVTIR